MAKQTFTTGAVLTAAQMNSLQANDYNWTVSQKTASYVLVAADAGTRIEMNAAGATTITVNTALFSAGDTLFIQNIGAGVTTITAGTATVQKASNASLALAQYQGGYLYFVSASNAVFFADAGFTSPLTTKGDLYGFSTLDARIPIGTNNQVLTADSAQALGLKWATPTSPVQNFTLLGTGTLTGASTITVSGISGINDLQVHIIGASSANASAAVAVQFNTDTGANYYRYGSEVYWPTTYTSGQMTQLNGATNFIRIGIMSTNAASVVSGYLTLRGCNSAGKKMFTAAGTANAAGGTDHTTYSLGGYYNSASTISSVSLTTSGNFDAGTFEIYGSA